MQRRVIVNGAHGKMGTITCEAFSKHPDFQLVASLGREDDLQKAIIETKAQIVVELTRADCVYQNTLTIINNNVHPVIGATGLLPEQIEQLQKLCDKKKLGGVIAPNFSISAALMMHFAKITSAYFSEVEIIEAHHQQKLEAPSGTAIKTAEVIAAARRKKKNQFPLKELLLGARGATLNDINIHSVRLPGLLACQQIIFGNDGETLSITHNTSDRTSFIPGILLACEQVTQLDKLYYGIDHFL